MDTSKFFSLRNLFCLFASFVSHLVIGLPLLFVMIVLKFLKHRDIIVVWDEVSPYTNIKLIFYNNRITRNMKKVIGSMPNVKDVVTNLSPKSGLLRIPKGIHVASYDSKSGMGVTYTSKVQKERDSLVSSDNKSFAYAQEFGSNKFEVDSSDIRDPNLKLLAEHSKYDILKAHSYITKGKIEYIKLNHKNHQSLVKVGLSHKERAFEVMHRCGGEKKVNDVIENVELVKIYLGVVETSKRMVFELSNLNTSKRAEVYFSKYQNIHQQLLSMYNTKELTEINKEEVEIIIQKIDELTRF